MARSVRRGRIVAVRLLERAGARLASRSATEEAPRCGIHERAARRLYSRAVGGVHEIVDADSVLRGAGTPAHERFDRFPPDFTIKGMFFQRLVRMVDPAELARLRVRLPAGGRYVAFKSYPQVEYSRLAHLAACTQYPRLDVREAMRRLARHDFEQFATTTVAKVALSFVGGCAEVLRRMPDLYRMTLDGGRFDSELIPGGVRMYYEDFYGWLDCYPVGTLEGICQRYGHSPRVEIHLKSDIDGHLDVTWSDPRPS